jgi:hypothetical protein
MTLVNSVLYDADDPLAPTSARTYEPRKHLNLGCNSIPEGIGYLFVLGIVRPIHDAPTLIGVLFFIDCTFTTASRCVSKSASHVIGPIGLGGTRSRPVLSGRQP